MDDWTLSCRRMEAVDHSPGPTSVREPMEMTGEQLEQFRGYLLLLARSHVDARFHANLEASDIVQQTMLEGFQRREQFRGDCEAQLATWLKQILMNNLADAVRALGRAKRDVKRECRLEAAIGDSFSRAEGWLVADQTSPSQRAANVEQLVHLAGCLSRLPDDQREAVMRHHLQGWTLAELAVHLQRSEGAVAGLLHRGLKQLKQMLSESDGELSRRQPQ